MEKHIDDDSAKVNP